MRYQPAVLAEEVYLHPRSALAATAPEYVVYSTLLATDKRRYLVGVTPLEPHWLGTSGTPLCTGEEGGGGGRGTRAGWAACTIPPHTDVCTMLVLPVPCMWCDPMLLVQCMLLAPPCQACLCSVL